jgi:hypothetical protein
MKSNCSYGDKKVMSLGNGLDPEELDYFAHVINKHLQRLHKRDENNRQDDDVLVEKKACAGKEYLYE